MLLRQGVCVVDGIVIDDLIKSSEADAIIMHADLGESVT
jgi:hypothetical protein